MPVKAIDKPRFSFLRTEMMHRLITALPIVAVNTVAVRGQLGWASAHLASWGLYGQIIFSVSLESIALSIAYHAHLAEKENDTAMGLKLASYAFGFIIGVLNFSHYTVNGHATTEAIVMGMLSSISPWLWAMFTRRVSRPRLMANKLVDEHALRLGMTRWIWHPIRCAVVMYNSTWTGESRVARAIENYNTSVADRMAAKAASKAATSIDTELSKIAA